MTKPPSEFPVDETRIAVLKSALREAPYPQLHNLEVHLLEDGCKILGKVPSFYFKQLAQEVLRETGVAGHISNGLSVTEQE